MSCRKLTVEHQSWPLEKAFTISRGSKSQADVIYISITESNLTGHSESVPYARYNESIQSVIEQIESVRQQIELGANRQQLKQLLDAGSARNALDCAIWDLQAKQQKTSVAESCQLGDFEGGICAQTLSIDSPKKMFKEALLLKNYPLIKVKLDNELVIERMQEVHKAAPHSKFIIDANEAWSFAQLNSYANRLQQLNTALIEQPLAAGEDKELINYRGSIPICADESIHTSSELESIAELYQYINIKLDKTGGLTEAIALLQEAKKYQLGIMVGCMVGTSLAMAPASLLASHAQFIDLDGPALLTCDRKHGFSFQTGHISSLAPELWGSAI